MLQAKRKLTRLCSPPLWAPGALIVLSLSSACAHDVTIESVPSGAQVEIDGQVAGKTPLVIERSAGLFPKAKLRATLDDHVPVEATVVGQDPHWPAVMIALCLSPLTCGLSLAALPFAARFANQYRIELDEIPKAEPLPATNGESAVEYSY